MSLSIPAAIEIFKVIVDRYPGAKKAFDDLIQLMQEREITMDDVAGFRGTLNTSMAELDAAIKEAEGETPGGETPASETPPDG